MGLFHTDSVGSVIRTLRRRNSGGSTPSLQGRESSTGLGQSAALRFQVTVNRRSC